MFSPQTLNLATGLRCNQSVLCLNGIFGAAGEALNSTNRSTAVGVGLHVSSSFDVRIHSFHSFVLFGKQTHTKKNSNR